MYIIDNSKAGVLQNIRFTNDNSLHRLGDMLSQLRNLQAVPQHTMNVEEFCSRMRKTDAMLSRWAQLVHKLISSKKLVLCQSLSQHQSTPHRLNFRVSLALTLQALEIRGVSHGILCKTRERLCASIDSLPVPPVSRRYRHVAFRAHNTVQ